MEHWMFAAKTSILHAFCENVDSSVLANIGCDLVWRNFMRISDCKFATSPTWLYAKTMEVNGLFDHASLNVEYDVENILSLCTTSYPLFLRIANISSCIATYFFVWMNLFKE